MRTSLMVWVIVAPGRLGHQSGVWEEKSKKTTVKFFEYQNL